MVPDDNTKIAGRYIIYRDKWLWQMQMLKSIIHTVQIRKMFDETLK